MMRFAAIYEVAVQAALSGDVKLLECAIEEASLPLGREAVHKMTEDVRSARHSAGAGQRRQSVPASAQRSGRPAPPRRPAKPVCGMDSGVSMGVSDVMRAREILFVAKGSHKAEIVKKALYGPVTEDVPASILHLLLFVEKPPWNSPGVVYFHNFILYYQIFLCNSPFFCYLPCNEPGTPFGLGIHIAPITDATKTAKQTLFGGRDKVPDSGVSMVWQNRWSLLDFLSLF